MKLNTSLNSNPYVEAEKVELIMQSLLTKQFNYPEVYC